MSEDNFESLSNAELRAKCLEHGLPNVPVTDSSRNLLIKRLRAVVAPDTPSKKTNRRETIHVSRTYTSLEQDSEKAETTSKEQYESKRATPSSNRNRRTIAGTSTMEVSAAPTPSKKEQLKQQVDAADNIPAPISVRRRSMREHSVQSISIANDDQPKIILEREDEEELIIAAEAVDLKKRSRPPSRAASLSKTNVVTVSYPQIQETIVEEKTAGVFEGMPKNIDMQSVYIANTLPSNTYKSTIRPFQPIQHPTYTQPMQRETVNLPRYTGEFPNLASSFYPPTSRRNTPAAAAVTAVTSTTATSTYNSKPYYNEMSDDTDANNEEPYETPYLSDFARTLERIKTEPLTRRNTLSGSVDGGAKNRDIPRLYKRRTMYETSVGTRAHNNSFTANLQRQWSDLNDRYNIKTHFIILLIMLFVVFLYVLFFL